MLKSARIRDYALIRDLELEFTCGLVIITGETGAGKSILVDALGLVLGARANAEDVRSGAARAVVEGVFDAAGNRHLECVLRAAETPRGDELILRREVSAQGQSRCFINDSPATLQMLRRVGDLVVDLHGQHEHQSLLRPATHLDLLDEFAGLETLAAQYGEAWARLLARKADLEDLRRRESHLGEKRTLYGFQIAEIDAVDPQPGEDEELETRLRVMENAEKLFGATQTLYRMLSEGEGSVRDQLVIARKGLDDLARIDPQFEAAAGECGSAEAVVSELARFIQSYNAQMEFSPEQVELARERLGRIAPLKRKYGGTLERVLEHRRRIGEEAALAENFKETIAERTREAEASRDACGALAGRLSAKRREAAGRLERSVVRELASLGIPDAVFVTQLARRPAPGGEEDLQSVRADGERVLLDGRGYDTAEFLISANPGEAPRPLVEAASGGEVSRIMLALKSILAKADRLPVLIFDEIDTGVSGRIAQAVGKSLKSLAAYHQVIAITHLPQIAGLADLHYQVAKEAEDGRTVVRVRRLDAGERVREVARLLSGAEVTETALKGARELMSAGKGK
ncbi:MAG: DNA repair protein RecN [Bacteroidota bacterium]